jgi:hypothetical protein
MISVRGNDLLIDLDKNKDTHYRNADMVTVSLNSNKAILKELGLEDNKAITRDMIASAVYPPITGKMQITLKDDAVKKDDELDLNNRVVTIDTPREIRRQFGVDVSEKELNARRDGFYNGEYKGFKYKISEDFNNKGRFHFVIDNTPINSTGSFIDGKFVPPQSSDKSIEEIEQDIKTYIDNR